MTAKTTKVQHTRNHNLSRSDGALMKFTAKKMGQRTQRNMRVKKALQSSQKVTKTKTTGTPRSLNDTRWYPTEDVPRKKYVNKRHVRKPTKIRSKIQPGQILILLTTQHRGKRVVFLKQLPSGLLLVTGPYKLNGCPFKRVSSSMVIATSTRVELPQLELSSVDDEFFKNITSRKNTKHMTDQAIAALKAEKKPLSQMQADVDSKLIEAIQKIPYLKSYVKRPFTMSNGIYPHKLVF